ncbi:hypothetical protein C8Q76DRAFT_824954 [Earliella scabrosa]|nr:hypothetical protein C8Q76DRAFT_824954 [Earliella scabrosa]
MLCTNRDEYFSSHRERALALLRGHSFGPISSSSDDDSDDEGSVLSGRDLAGGTWAGVIRSGRLTPLTNITESPKATLEAEISVFLEENRDRAYAGFNLLFLSPAPGALGPHGLSLDGAFLTNGGGGGPIAARMLSAPERRCGGMFNGVRHGTDALLELLDSLPQDATEAEIETHANTMTYYYYGTLLSTIVLIRRDGSVTFIGQDVWAVDTSTDAVVTRDSGRDRVFRFQIEAPEPNARAER